MAANNFHELPNPHSSVSGSNLEDKGNQKPSKIAEKWRPRGAPVTEPKVATISRFANYLIDRITGKAYSANELLSRPVAAADITDPENLVTKSRITTAGAALARKYLHGPNTGMRAFRTKLDRGNSAAMLFLSDSTGVPSDGWIRLFANALASRYTSHRVLYNAADYNGTNASSVTVIQAGSERQHWLIGTGVTTNAPFLPNASYRTQLGGRYGGIEVEIAPTSDAALNGSGFPTTSVEAGCKGTNNGMWLSFSSFGQIALNWYDGDGFHSKNNTGGTSIPAMVVGTYVRYRALIDTANGANRTIDFHYSTDQGATWTRVGSAVSEAKSTNSDIAATTSTTSTSVGRVNSANCGVGYKYSHLQLFTGSSNEPVLPERIDGFMVVAGATTNTPTLAGSPTIYLDVVAVNGAGIASTSWFGQTLPTYAYNLLRDRNHDVCVISSSHNDVFLSDASWSLRMDALRTLVSGRRPVPPAFLHVCQNPESTDYAAAEIRKQHNARQAGIMGYAATKGSPCLDAYQAFLDDGRTLAGTLIRAESSPGVADGVHPTTDGYQVWHNAFWNSCFLDGTNE